MMKSTIRIAITLLTLLYSLSVSATLWKLESPTSTAAKGTKSDNVYYSVNSKALNVALGEAKVKSTVLEVPMPDGSLVQYQLKHDPIYSQKLAEKFPEITTYSGFEVGKPSNTGRFDLTPSGFHGMVSYNGRTVFVDPVKGERSRYHSFYRISNVQFADDVIALDSDRFAEQPQTAARGITERRVYRLIIATTGEYSQYHGGSESSVQAEITTAINRVNQIYQTELSVSLQLVETLIHLDALADPYTNNDAEADIDTNRELLEETFGVSAFDIGHLFATDTSGLAYIGAVCWNGFKGGGVTGSISPEGDSFYVDYVAHEMGHQLGANHTFNGTRQACEAPNRNDSTAVEPGSGSTIMGYAGICGRDNLQSSGDPYFHAASINEIHNYLASFPDCGSASNLTTSDPEVDAGIDYIVPSNTPLRLEGSATDVDAGEVLSYSWEQMDAGDGNSELDSDQGYGPLFRTWPPQSTSIRYLPRLEDVLAESLVKGETYPVTSREINMRLTVRDGNGGVEHDDMKITVDGNSGPFALLSPTGGETLSDDILVEWNPAGTNQEPISCSAVNISLSTDNGSSFSESLVSATPNDGNQLVQLPDIDTAQARLMISCSDNIFFAVTSTFQVEVGEPANQNPVIVNDQTTIEQDSEAILVSVLANDSDPDDDQLTITRVEYGGTGVASIAGEQIRYQPANGYSGTEMISYEVSDGRGGSAIATLIITVIANGLPVAVNDSLTVEQGSLATLIDVLANDSDPDEETLTLTGFSYSGVGSVLITGNLISYQPASTFSGTESLTYTISDERGGEDSATLTITVNASPNPTPPPTPAPTPTTPTASSGGGGGTVGVYYLIALWGALWIRRKYR